MSPKSHHRHQQQQQQQRQLPAKPAYPPPPPPSQTVSVRSSLSPTRSEPSRRRAHELSSSEDDDSSDEEHIVNAVGGAERRARPRGRRSAFSREGLGRRSMSEKRHAMEAAQNFAFFQELSASRQRQGHGSSSSQAEDPLPAASSEMLLQRCQRLMAQRHPSTDSLGRHSSRHCASEAAAKPAPANPASGLSSSLRSGPLKSVGPMLGREDSASQLSTASTTLAHHPRQRRCRPISFRRAVDHSLPEPDDAPASRAAAVAAQEGSAERPARPRAPKKASGGFWRGLLGRKKGGPTPPAASIVSEPPPTLLVNRQSTLTTQLDAEARVLAWQRRNEAVLAGQRPNRLPSASSAVAHEAGASSPGNRAFSVYIPAAPEDYATLGDADAPRRNSLVLTTAAPRRNSLTYGEEEEMEVAPATGRLQLAR